MRVKLAPSFIVDHPGEYTRKRPVQPHHLLQLSLELGLLCYLSLYLFDATHARALARHFEAHA